MKDRRASAERGSWKFKRDTVHSDMDHVCRQGMEFNADAGLVHL
jgi:hypothetical protein